MSQWALPPTAQARDPITRRMSRVLIEYEGPRAAFFTDEMGSIFFGVASDEDEGHVRWIVSEISPLEAKGIALRATTLRQALTQERVDVVDFDMRGNPSAAWHVAFSEVPLDALPEVSALLPPLTEPVLREILAGELAQREGIDLGEGWVS